jgi:hypothetical protein
MEAGRQHPSTAQAQRLRGYRTQLTGKPLIHQPQVENLNVR